MANLEKIVGNNKHLEAVELQGYWPKTSSVNFCEGDYQHSHYIAELHNVWTSAIFVALAIYGAIHSNPTREMQFTATYVLMAACGLGSMILHGTLTSAGQAGDEVPMLVLCSSMLFCLVSQHAPRNGAWSLRQAAVPALAVLQTALYFKFQSFYHFFVSSYVCIVLFIVAWLYRLVANADRVHKEVRQHLFNRGMANYFALGSTVWIMDMQLCGYFRPYQDKFGGISFHVLWHFGAAYGTYYVLLLLQAIRMQNLGLTPQVKWPTFFAPILTIYRE